MLVTGRFRPYTPVRSGVAVVKDRANKHSGALLFALDTPAVAEVVRVGHSPVSDMANANT